MTKNNKLSDTTAKQKRILPSILSTLGMEKLLMKTPGQLPEWHEHTIEQ